MEKKIQGAKAFRVAFTIEIKDDGKERTARPLSWSSTRPASVSR
jgi:hypothetical protein